MGQTANLSALGVGFPSHGGRIIECNDCQLRYGTTVSFCPRCEADGRAEHDATHKFCTYTWTVQINPVDLESFSCRCLDCGKT